MKQQIKYIMKRMKFNITIGLVTLLVLEFNTLLAQGPAWFDR